MTFLLVLIVAFKNHPKPILYGTTYSYDVGPLSLIITVNPRVYSRFTGLNDMIVNHPCPRKDASARPAGY